MQHSKAANTQAYKGLRSRKIRVLARLALDISVENLGGMMGRSLAELLFETAFMSKNVAKGLMVDAPKSEKVQPEDLDCLSPGAPKLCQ